MTIQDQKTRLLELADDTEKTVAEWIKHNPHVALVYALATHQTHFSHSPSLQHHAQFETISMSSLANCSSASSNASRRESPQPVAQCV